jgi:8-oxo-dGTP pyrophosphatase MutT (NUDIX family)
VDPITREIRAAATVIAARPALGGVEVLVLRRGRESRFLPGYVVFPGGAVDTDDARRAARWFGSPVEAARAAAVRELAEEAGLVVTRSGIDRGPELRPLAPVDEAPPAIQSVPQISHWVAPESVPVRFDARYFAVAAPLGIDPRPDGREAVEAWWASPAELLDGWAAGARRLYWPTMKTMEALARCASVEEVLALAIPQQEPDAGDEAAMPRSTFYQDA